MGLFVWDSEPSKIFVWDTPISKVFLWDTQVRPSGWQPWANTLAYYPLTSTSTVNDMSGNNRNLTNNWSTTFWTYWGISCASMNWYLYNWSLSWTLTTLTMSCWFWEISKGKNYYLFMWLKSWTSWTDTNNLFFMYEWEGRPSGTWFGLQYWESWSINSWTATSKWAWHNWVITWDWSVIKAYLDGTQVATRNRTTAVARNTIMLWWGSFADKYMSEAIYENVCWNAQKVSAYYNQTKWNYWL